jgi:two-component system CheB/CheR fusion protein
VAKSSLKKNKKPVADNNLHPVVAIGASSGGLQALSELLEHLPPDLGMTYVIIQHLSPDHESILPELLARKTNMKVHTVGNGLHIEPDNIYVIPPNTYMSIVDSILTLSERVKSHGSYHAIDFFLTSLAPIYQAKAIAVILSGSGTDGTIGVQAIKENGGLVFAQDETAGFSGMPKTASESGFTDFVLPCKRIAEELMVIAKNPDGIFTINESAGSHESELKKIHHLLLNAKGVNFSYYKQTTINRRILRRMALGRFKTIAEYTKFLGENSKELDVLYKDLLINVTSFFREPNVYEALSKKIFPALFKNRKPNDIIRVWTPACATGEEAYSLAICIFEYLKDKALSTSIQIFGTDLNDTAIDKARSGLYRQSALENLSPQRLNKFFQKADGQYQVIKAIRDMCIFATHNLLQDPPFSRMDLISCQNVLIYLESNPQKKILESFHYSLKPAGYLLLGRSETIGNSTELFGQEDKDLRIYSKKQTSPGSTLFDFSVRPATAAQAIKQRLATDTPTDIDIEKETDRLLLSRYVPASVVVNKDLQILRFHGATSNYLQPSSGRASLHLLKMVKDDLVLDLKGLISKAQKEGVPVKKSGILLSQNDSEKLINIEIAPVKSGPRDFYYLVVFREEPVIIETKSRGKHHNIKAISKKERTDQLEHQLTEAREYMKTMSEEFEATREELQSANEEILSSNEELQSINEEMETSKEELQSTNEELVTINDELQHRNRDLKEMNDYMQAIVETMNEPLAVLNMDMRVLSANKAFYKIFRTNADHTEGNGFFEMENGQWNIPGLRDKLSEIIHKEISFENFEKTYTFPVIGEKTLLFNAMRMQEENNKNRKILLAIQDVTEQKNAVRDLRENEERLRLLLENSFDITMILSKEGRIVYQSDSLERSLGYQPMQTVNKNIFELEMTPPDNRDQQQELFLKALGSSANVTGHVKMRHSDQSVKIMQVVLRNRLDQPGIQGIIANYQDITDSVSQ